MDKNAIKKYAVWAREQLIEKVTARAIRYEIVDGQGLNDSLETINGEVLTETEKKQRKALIQKIKSDGYGQVMEEVAYTWFNRFVAIRFMEVNGYLPSHVRVFSDENGAFKPQILAEAIHLDLPGLDMDKVMQYKEEANEDELFKYLLKVQCNALNEILPQMFQKIEDYTELLLPDYLLRDGSVIEKLVNEIPEDNFDVNTENGQIEVIGWMYQYYISAKHEEVVDPLHGKVVKKEEVPAATQLFTTDWVVRYLIDNSVGRYWIERNPESKLADELTYFVKPKDGVIKTVDEKITPQDVTVFDPCVGSGHFLVYAFDVLMKIYVEYGYSERDAAAEIIKSNLYGLDIDGRAAQLAYFAVMMKARQYDRRFLAKNIQPNVYEITESNNADRACIEYFYADNTELKKDVEDALSILKDAKEYGSILHMPDVDFDKINVRLSLLNDEISMYRTYLLGDFQRLIKPVEIMSRQYAVVATNPPYLNKYDNRLREYIFAKYNPYKGDLFSVFMVRNVDYCKPNGYCAFMTPNVWMFISSYENTREFVLSGCSISSLIQIAKGSFFKEATVDVCAFVVSKRKKEKGMYFRLEDFKADMEAQRDAFLSCLKSVESCNYVFYVDGSNFAKISGSPIAFWVSDSILSDFADSDKSVKDYSNGEGKNVTTNNSKYILYYWEVSITDVGAFDYKWLPCATGGDYRKWYGNVVNVIDWSEQTRSYYKKASAGRIIREEFWPMRGITWGKISSAASSFRLLEEEQMYQETAILQKDKEKTFPILALLNSCVSGEFLKFLSPTINFQLQDICTIPVMKDIVDNKTIIELSKRCVELAKNEWNDYEISYEFQSHPLVPMSFERIEQLNAGMNSENRKKAVTLLSERYNRWEKECEARFLELKRNEEDLNRIFIDIYGLQDELRSNIEDKDVSVRKANLQRDVRSLISYAVGCMFGRYSIDVPGIAYAGGEWDGKKYKSFVPDKDAIIPICDDEYFSDDIVGCFIGFIETAYGKDMLEENLQFIADALGGNGSSREVIRNYFINDFYADHLKTYQKRPIYWLFDSGKKNGFKCLVYMHRYKPDTIARIRTDYVHEQQARYRTAIEEIEKRIDSVSSSEKVKLNKRLNILKDQDEELHAYEEKIHHLADQMISIDLDDGVKHNYELFKDVLAKIK